MWPLRVMGTSFCSCTAANRSLHITDAPARPDLSKHASDITAANPGFRTTDVHALADLGALASDLGARA